MENPFNKEKTTLITGLVLGGAVAAGLAYLFFTEEGQQLLAGWTNKAKEAAKDIAAGIVSDKTGMSEKTIKKLLKLSYNTDPVI
jgi:hypothetical protein